MWYSSAEERRAAVPNVPGSIPGITHIFVVYFVVLGKIWCVAPTLILLFLMLGAPPPTCRFGMMCSYTLRSHATHTEGSFSSMAESSDLILRHAFWPFSRTSTSDYGALHQHPTPPYKSFSPYGGFYLLLFYPFPGGMEGGGPRHWGPKSHKLRSCLSWMQMNSRRTASSWKRSNSRHSQ